VRILPATSGDFVGVSEHAVRLPMMRSVAMEPKSFSDLIFLPFLAKHFI
jgi:hypothetical protein